MNATTDKLNNPKITKLVRVTISLDPTDYESFERLAEKNHLSRSWLIRKAMRDFLERSLEIQEIDPL